MGRKVICIQGLGFVGSAMATAVAAAEDQGVPRFDVVGVELDSPFGKGRAEAIEEGRFPFPTTDDLLVAATARAVRETGNLSATCDPTAFERADVVVVSVGLDIDRSEEVPRIAMDGFLAAMQTLGRRIREGTLVIIETTVPPGTCERVVAPLLEREFLARGLPSDGFLLAHSYERVTPGRDYLRSITNFWRCYAGHTDEAAEACAAFLEQVINVEEYPLRRLSSTTASETAKVLENTYRATTIAMMEEWGRFAEGVGIDLFEVIDAVRVRPTHSNMRQPGFGVGGYCLTKDPLFAEAAARELFQRPDLRFPFATQAVEVNFAMPTVTLEHLDELLDGLEGRSILLLGVSYRPDVGDTRHSPSELFVREARARGAKVVVHDPLVPLWEELDEVLPEAMPGAEGLDAVVLAVGHLPYRTLDYLEWMGKERPLVFDANAVLSPEARSSLREAGCRVHGIGLGVSP